jgi:hypothetical protein
MDIEKKCLDPNAILKSYAAMNIYQFIKPQNIKIRGNFIKGYQTITRFQLRVPI